MENKLGFGEQNDKGHAPNKGLASMLADVQVISFLFVIFLLFRLKVHCSTFVFNFNFCNSIGLTVGLDVH
jgi:hypothetical protein